MVARSDQNTSSVPLIPAVLATITAFLLPLITGSLSVETIALAPGESPLASLFNASPVPQLGVFLACLPAILAIVLHLAKTRVTQIPNFKIAIPLVTVLFLTFLSVFLSSYKSISLASLLQWNLAVILFFTFVAVCGRTHGKWVIGAIVAGLSISALMGILEYGAARAADPNHRIFATFNNPNAAAAAFAIGIPLALGLSAASERLGGLLAALGALLQSFALFLTQSKGGILFAGIAVICFAIVVLASKTKLVGKAIGVTVVVLVLGGVMSFGSIQARKAPTPNGAPQASSVRLANSEEAVTQSAGFRTLLWKGSLAVIKANPVGTGIGTYRFYSTKAGLTTQTALTHNSYLQMALETSVVSVAALGAFVLVTLGVTARGLRSRPDSQKAIYAATIGALAGALGHNLIDSDLATFGLLGITLILFSTLVLTATDASSPEFLTPAIRGTLGCVAAATLLLTGLSAVNELRRSQARGLIEAGQVVEARTILDGILAATPNDGQARALRALVPTDEADLLTQTERSAQTHPSPKSWRAYASACLRAGKTYEAIFGLEEALAWDPNNLSALRMLITACQEFGDIEKAKKSAERLVAVESTTYYTVRSQPEFIPTETAEARMFLASQEANTEKKAELLKAAAKIYGQYLKTTVPVVERFIASGSNGIGGETREVAIAKVEAGLNALRELKNLQGAVEGVEPADFEAALSSLRK